MKRSNIIEKEETLKYNFKEIINFYQVDKKEPSLFSNDLYERLLAKRLFSIREIYDKYSSLSELDIYGLLSKNNIPGVLKSKPVQEESEELNKFASLTNLVKCSTKKKKHPPQSAKKMICQQFSLYESLFKEVRAGLAERDYGKEEIITFNKDVTIGDYFLNNGILSFVSDIVEETTLKGINLRLKLITEDGLEFDMLYQSFIRGLYKNITFGSKITSLNKPLPSLKSIPVSGYIYILSSLNNYEELAPFKELYKIDFVVENAERKIKEAHLYTNYLESPVEVVSVIQCFNLEMIKLKKAVTTKLKPFELTGVKIKSKRGNLYGVKNWLNAPLSTIENTILEIGNKK